MTTADVVSGSQPSAGAVAFLGREGAYWRLRIKGAALVMLTLGIYRFWLATDVRRYLWSNTEIAGETLEYNGLATELLVGFLLAIAIVVPLYTAFAIVALADAVTFLSVMFGILLVALLGEFALYRARHYRLTRTVFRGVRFDQHGSAWNYAWRAVSWWAAVIVTLGFAYPWAQASLQRFKMRHTSYGDLPGGFAGTGSALFVRGFPIWLVVVLPLVVGFIAASGLVDWDSLSKAIGQGDDDAIDRLIENSPQLGLAFGIAFTAVVTSIIAFVALFPFFQAVLLRWWISGLRFGSVAATSKLRTGAVYRVYLRFALYLALFVSLAVGFDIALLHAVDHLLAGASNANQSELAASTMTLCFYVVIALGASTIYQVVVTAAMWRLGAQSAELAGAQALDNVRATGAESSALGEGLADALGVGGV
jgi:uncharacterized membrane protein YjgN (DUF898 family)